MVLRIEAPTLRMTRVFSPSCNVCISIVCATLYDLPEDEPP